MKSKPSLIKTYSGEALTYKIADYPAVKLHFPFNEVSGTSATDEATGLVLTPGGGIEYGNPAYSMTLTGLTGGAGQVTGDWPVLDLANKYYYLVQSCRSLELTGFPSGSVSLAGNGTAQFTGGYRQGAHITIVDDEENAVALQPQEAKQLTAGTDYLLVLICRPIGGNAEIRCYTTDGALLYSDTAANAVLASTATITLTSLSGVYGQSNLYQKTLYEFTAEPADLAVALAWHASMAPRGYKSPYPGWRNKT